MSVKVLCVAGTRPNFVKVAALMRCLAEHPLFRTKLVHTGQHYDADLSGIFFRQLRMPVPDIELEVGSGSHASQTAEIMRRFEAVLEDEQPQVVLVVGRHVAEDGPGPFDQTFEDSVLDGTWQPPRRLLVTKPGPKLVAVLVEVALQTGDAVRCGDDLIPLEFEVVTQACHHIGLVLDNQDSGHISSSQLCLSDLELHCIHKCHGDSFHQNALLRRGQKRPAYNNVGGEHGYVHPGASQ